MFMANMFLRICNFSSCYTVPLQNNTWDCGVFVCRYAFAIYELRYRNFTYGDAGMYCNAVDVSRGEASRAFHDLISDGAEFDFNMDDIARFREEFKVLIERLTNLYKKSKDAEKAVSEQEKQRKRQALDSSSFVPSNTAVSEEASTVAGHAREKNIGNAPEGGLEQDQKRPAVATATIHSFTKATEESSMLVAPSQATESLRVREAEGGNRSYRSAADDSSATSPDDTAPSPEVPENETSGVAAELGILNDRMPRFVVSDEKENVKGSKEASPSKSLAAVEEDNMECIPPDSILV